MEPIDLSPLFKTKSQAADFLVRLDAVIKALYQANFNAEKVLLEQFGMEHKDILMGMLTEYKVAVDNPSQLKQFLEKIKEQTNKMPILNLTLAFQPRETTLKVVSDWFLLNLKQQVLFDIKVNTQLIGGASIDFKGRHFENSLKPKIEAILNAFVTKSTASQTTNNHQSIEHMTFGR